MKKAFLSLAVMFIFVVGTNTAMAGPHDNLPYHARFNSSRVNNRPPRHLDYDYHQRRYHNPPPPPLHPIYYPAPIIPMNQVVTIRYPNASYYYSTPYYSYPSYYYPNKTLTVRTKHVLLSI